MPRFQANCLFTLSYAGGHAHWLYQHRGLLAEAVAPGFWLGGEELRSSWLNDRDLLTIIAQDGATMRVVRKQEQSLRLEELH